MTSAELRPVITYPRDAIVETAHIATALGVSRDAVGKLDLPCFYIGAKPRFLWGQVLDVLAERASPDAAKSLPHRRARKAS